MSARIPDDRLAQKARKITDKIFQAIKNTRIQDKITSVEAGNDHLPKRVVQKYQQNQQAGQEQGPTQPFVAKNRIFNHQRRLLHVLVVLAQFDIGFGIGLCECTFDAFSAQNLLHGFANNRAGVEKTTQ